MYITTQTLTSTTDGNPAEATIHNAKSILLDAEDADIWVAYSVADLDNAQNRFKLKAADGPMQIPLTSEWSGTLYFAYVAAVGTDTVSVWVF